MHKRKIIFGVPQGSVLFLVYINGIHKRSEIFDFHLFADDTNILYDDKSLKSLKNVVNNKLKYIIDWLNANKLTLNSVMF